MSQNLTGDESTPEFIDVRHGSVRWRLYATFRALSQVFEHILALPVVPQSFLRYLRRNVKQIIIEVEEVTQDDRWHRLYSNSRAFFSRCFVFMRRPSYFGFLISDYGLLLQSTWSGRQLGSEVVYPMQRIRKRQSGSLAKLILAHCRTVRWNECSAATAFPRGIDPPCVAVIDIDAQDTCSTQFNLYGFTCFLVLFEVVIVLIMFALNPWEGEWFAFLIRWTMRVLNVFILVIFRGEGALVLARRSNVSTLGCAVLLDQDFTVLLNGSESTLEAIAEGSFNYPRYDGTTSKTVNLHVYLLCECLLLFAPIPLLNQIALFIIIALYPLFRKRRKLELLAGVFVWVIYHQPILSVALHGQDTIRIPLSFDRRVLPHLSTLPFFLFFVGYKPRSYPISCTKLLDALGRPQIRKWQFDTLAAAATFQSLVLCHCIARPVESIDVLTYLDMLIPDQRDIWKAWKERVADRIVHETDISFAPTIPTFGDGRQVQLRDLLKEAQYGCDTYRRSYVSVMSPDHLSGIQTAGGIERFIRKNSLVLFVVTTLLMSWVLGA